MNVIVCGSKGRMGSAIISLIAGYDNLSFIGGVDSSYIGDEITSEHSDRFLTLKEALLLTKKIENRVIIDFTSRNASMANAEEAASHNVPIVVGSTGFSAEDVKIIEGYGERIPVVLSGNMSLGINVLLNVVYEVSKYLGSDYDCEIIEMHHRRKKDAPSGTAKMLAESVAKQRNVDLSENVVFGRCGDIGERKKDEIGISSVRAGDIIGEHKVIFAGNEETIEVSHKAISRNNFARGAIKAAVWIGEKNKGFYDMRDVLGLNKNG
ncbi:4-hydroxy-tetrahydrodipicolinate reductase [Candidatus Acidulodesulfobacterium sp. H_13]|uniref:4-hydroxy-tetrahydrodipicolinate reductase n=1 Tax=Candidatus Acidulodesulfobacterium sp. H_13 TaxID=3395470 RepID=UPI003AF98816